MLPLEEYIKLLPVVLPVYALIYYICGVYAPKRTVRRRFEIFGIIKANNIGIVALIIVLYMIIREINFSRSVIGFFYIINVLVTSSFRLALRRGLRTIRRKGYNLKHILLVGYSRAAEEYVTRINANPQW